MTGYTADLLQAAWLGLLTAVMPCPLATNVAAISYVGRDLGRARRTLLAGVLYSLGRALTYGVIGFVMVRMIEMGPTVSRWLETHMNRITGPVLIVVGVVLLEWVPVRLNWSPDQKRAERVARLGGVAGPLLLGMLLALTFCPPSASLFFLRLVPIAAEHHGSVVFPVVFGLATAAPVLVFAVLIAGAGHLLSRAFKVVTTLEWWARRVTGGVFIVVGLYQSCRYIYNVDLLWWLKS